MAASTETTRSQTSSVARLSMRGMALAFGLLWGAIIFGVSLIHLANPSYGAAFLSCVSSVYPGFHAARSFSDAVLGGVYAFLDGAVDGVIFAWLYNRVSQRSEERRVGKAC